MGAFMRTTFLCISVLSSTGTQGELASCKSALNTPVVYSTDRSKAMIPVLVLLFAALWFILRDDLFNVLPCVILFLRFSVLLVLGKRELIVVLFVRLFDLYLFGFVDFLFLFVSGKGCGLWLWHSLDFSLTLFSYVAFVLSSFAPHVFVLWSLGKVVLRDHGIPWVSSGILYILHYENTPIQIYWEFYHQKMKTFRWKILVVFTAEIRKLMYTPVNPSCPI